MTKLTFEMKPYDFENARNVIGPFHLDNDIERELYFDIINELEFGVFGVGIGGYRMEDRSGEDYIVIDGRISFELEDIIEDILRQEES